jgi:hypothetical protein
VRNGRLRNATGCPTCSSEPHEKYQLVERSHTKKIGQQIPCLHWLNVWLQLGSCDGQRTLPYAKAFIPNSQERHTSRPLPGSKAWIH